MIKSLPMKKTLLAFAVLGFSNLMNSQTPFNSSNIVVTRIGTGAAALSNAAQAVFLDEYYLNTTTGAATLVQSIALPTADNGTDQTLTLSGTSTSEGALQLSADGKFLTIGGYDAAPGTASVSTAAGIDRIIALIGSNGTINTSTGITSTTGYVGNSIRSVVTIDGTAFWCSGTGTGGGTRYVPFGSVSATSVQLSSAPTNTRVTSIFNGQLYMSAASGAFQGLTSVGTGIPTTTGQTTSILPGFPTTAGPSPYAFQLLDMDAGVPGVDVAYVADDRAAPNGGIQKWSLVGGTWVLNGTIAVGTTGARGLTVRQYCSNVILIATTNNTVTLVNDNAGYNATPSTPAALPVINASTNTVFRGVSNAPSATTVSYLIEPTFNVTSTSICSGDPILALPTTANNGVTGTWSPALDNTTTTDYIFTPTAGQCADTTMITITVNPITSTLTNATTCGSYTWSADGQTYTSSGTYTYVVGCNTDSLVLTITNPTSTLSTQSICGTSYTWTANGQTYNASGIYTNTVGCNTDSLILTLNPLTNTVLNDTACNTYTWSANSQTYTSSGTYLNTNACNTDTLHLVINAGNANSTTASACASYTWSVDGLTYSTSGTYIVTAGCNSDTLHLTISTVDLSVSAAGTTITATETGATYQWIDCNTNSAIAGETSQSYTATANGDYAVVITSGACSDTSACTNITGIGLNSLSKTSAYSIYPNPSNGKFTINTNGTVNQKIEVLNLIGQVVYTATISGKQDLDLSSFEAGVYTIKFVGSTNTFAKLIKQ